MIERLKNLQDKPLSPYHQGVVKDLSKAIVKWGKLTHRQEAFFLSIESQYTDEAIVEREQSLLKLQTDEQYRKDVRAICEYYKTTGYYRNTFTKALEFLKSGDVKNAPSPQALSKMMNNKYATNILASVNSEPKFEVGELVQLRSNVSWDNVQPRHLRSKELDEVRNTTAFMVVEIDSSPVSRPLTYHPTQGGTRWYKLLSMGSTRTIEVVERELKRPTKKAMGKK